MVIAFQKQFKDVILSGSKKHTIREDKHNRWKPGMKMHMASGVRTKDYNQFYEAVCVSTQKIEVIRTSDYLEETIIKIDGKILNQSEVQKLAWNDGFHNQIELFLFFSDGFKGKIIHWTELKY